MKKQAIKILIMFLLSCSIAYFIGQKVVLPLTNQKTGQNEQQKTEDNLHQGETQSEEANTEIYDLIENFSDLTLTGQRETDDNPWGSNITDFEDEEHGTCILMTPGTEITVQYIPRGQERLSWSCDIHPWMAEVSDGADLNITVRRVGTDTQETENIFRVVPTESFEEGNILLDEFLDTEVEIVFSVGNGEHNDSSGDWLVFDRLVIEPR